MLTVDQVAKFLDSFAPIGLAEGWDNVGLLVGDAANPARRIMTCLTITGASAAEAVAQQVDLIVTHHPLPFAALKKLTTESHDGRLLWTLAGAQISVYSPHTAFDSAADGINQRLAVGVGLTKIEPLVAPTIARDESTGKAEAGATLGAGRCGILERPGSLAAFAERVKQFLQIERVQLVESGNREVQKVAVACGSAGELLEDARRQGCDCFLTGESRFHTALAAEAAGVSLILAGHYATERFGVEHLAEVLASKFPAARVWASEAERDPLIWA